MYTPFLQPFSTFYTLATLVFHFDLLLLTSLDIQHGIACADLAQFLCLNTILLNYRLSNALINILVSFQVDGTMSPGKSMAMGPAMQSSRPTSVSFGARSFKLRKKQTQIPCDSLRVTCTASMLIFILLPQHDIIQGSARL